MQPRDVNLETEGHEADERFPSGPWTGFFLQKQFPGRHWMDLKLAFKEGRIDGTGRDWVGKFLVRGRYVVDDGRCTIHKKYLGMHEVVYSGYNEGKGIWGTWELPAVGKGGFHIWPVSMGDPTGSQLREAIEQPHEMAARQSVPREATALSTSE